MKAIIKKPFIKIEGKNIPEDMINEKYKVYFQEDGTEEWENVDNWEPYKNFEKSYTPSQALKLNRLTPEWTQEQLVQKLGITKQRISEMERGVRGISKEMAKKLAKIFDCSVEEFI